MKKALKKDPARASVMKADPATLAKIRRREDYVRERTRRLAVSLNYLVRRHNKSLSVSCAVVAKDRHFILKIDVVQERVGYGVKPVWDSKSPLIVKWTKGKSVTTTIDIGHEKLDMTLNRRAGPQARALFGQIKSILPIATPDELTSQHAVRTSAPHLAAALRDKIVKRMRKKITGKRQAVKVFETKHIDYIRKRIERVQIAFESFAGHMFQDVHFDHELTNIPQDIPNAPRTITGKAAINIRLRPLDVHHRQGTPREIRIAGDLRLLWQTANGPTTKLEMLNIQGLTGPGAPTLAPINLSRAAEGIAHELYNSLVTSGQLANPGQIVNSARRKREVHKAPPETEESMHKYIKHHNEKERLPRRMAGTLQRIKADRGGANQRHRAHASEAPILQQP